MNNEESERITTSQDVISRLHDKIDEQQARIAELEDAADIAIERIAELEGQLEAIGAGGVEPLRKQAAQAVHQIAEPAAPVGKPIKDAIDALVMAAFTEGGCSEHRMSEARIQTELRKKELRTLIAATQPAAQGMDAQTIKHISALSELVRMPNAEYFADAHNAAVRHLRALGAKAKE